MHGSGFDFAAPHTYNNPTAFAPSPFPGVSSLDLGRLWAAFFFTGRESRANRKL